MRDYRTAPSVAAAYVTKILDECQHAAASSPANLYARRWGDVPGNLAGGLAVLLPTPGIADDHSELYPRACISFSSISLPWIMWNAIRSANALMVADGLTDKAAGITEPSAT